ncbi:thiamine pyrophosphate-binding protein [Streptomyces sp. NPDC006733]|uniref:thiamine pyrophosphate-binding protein n=1 Tax=Streptomyces sp. NPDC006733 TaxID=3155460 RepID=UPI0033E3FC8E
MSTTVSDHLLSRLREWGVEQVSAYPGDGINGLLAAWGRADDNPRFIQARHEEMAAFQAVGHAKFSGKVGVYCATSGPGAIHLLNGLYDAKLDHVPVVAIVGRTDRSAIGGSYQQEVDLHSLFKDVASDFVETVTVPEQLPDVLDRAIRTAYTRRAPTAVIIPADVQELEYAAPTHDFTMVPSSLGVSEWSAIPAAGALAKAADVLIALVGDGAMQMNGLAELITAAKYRAEWQDPRLVVAVWNNQDLNQVGWEMRALRGAPRFLPSQSLPDVPYAEFAASIGLTGIRVEKPEDVTPAWDAALTASGPVVVEFRTDPAVPPIPPHATWEQMEATAAALLTGDSDRAGMIKQGVKAKIQEFLPGRKKAGEPA